MRVFLKFELDRDCVYLINRNLRVSFEWIFILGCVCVFIMLVE